MAIVGTMIGSNSSRGDYFRQQEELKRQSKRGKILITQVERNEKGEVTKSKLVYVTPEEYRRIMLEQDNRENQQKSISEQVVSQPSSPQSNQPVDTRPFTDEYKAKEKMQQQGIQPKPFLSPTDKPTLNNYMLYSRGQESEDRQTFVGELQKHSTKVDVAKVVTPFRPEQAQEQVKVGRLILENTNLGFYSQEALGKARGAVYQKYIDAGYTPEYADFAERMQFKSFKSDIQKELAVDIFVGVAANLAGAGLIAGGSKVLSAANVGGKALYYGSRAVGMIPAGTIEYLGFVGARKELTMRQDYNITPSEVGKAAVFGGGSAFAAQVFMEQGARGLIGMPGKIPYYHDRTVNFRENLLYTFDPLEPVSDRLTELGGGSLRVAKAGVFTNIFADSQPSNVFDTTFTDVTPETTTKTSSLAVVNTNPIVDTLTNTEVSTRSTPLTKSYVFMNNRPSSGGITVNPVTDVLPNDNTDVVPDVRPNNQITTSPYTNVVPLTNTNVNPLVNTNPEPFTKVHTIQAPLPILPGGFRYNKGKDFVVRSRPSYQYRPSLVGAVFNIKSPKSFANKQLSGLEVRGYINGGKKVKTKAYPSNWLSKRFGW